MKHTLAGSKQEVGLVTTLPQGFVLLGEPLQLGEFKVTAYRVISDGNKPHLAMHIEGSDLDVHIGKDEIYYDIAELMSQLVEAKFKPVPTGISSNLSLRELENTVFFLRQLEAGAGLGNYLVYDPNDESHRPIPIRSYSRLRVSLAESITVVVHQDIPVEILNKLRQTTEAAAA